jgi:hypothetical protein
MINLKTTFPLLTAVSLAFAVAAFAAETKTFRAVGNILHVTDAKITIRTSAQDLEITRDAKTKVNGDLKTGQPATVMYVKVSGQPHATEVTMGGPAKAAKKN